MQEVETKVYVEVVITSSEIYAIHKKNDSKEHHIFFTHAHKAMCESSGFL